MKHCMRMCLVSSLCLLVVGGSAWAAEPAGGPVSSQIKGAVQAGPAGSGAAPAVSGPAAPAGAVQPAVQSSPPAQSAEPAAVQAERPVPQSTSDLVVQLTAEKQRWYATIAKLAAGPLSSQSTKEFRDAEAEVLKIKDPDALEPMALVLYSPNARWRSVFVKAIDQFARSKQEPGNLLAVTYLSDVAVLDESVLLRGQARSALLSKESPKQTDRLQYQLASAADPEARDRAAGLLADLKDASALAMLIEMLTTEETRVKGAWVDSRSVQMDLRVAHAGPAAFTTVNVPIAVPGAAITGQIMLPTVRMTEVHTTVSAPAGYTITPDYETVSVGHAGVLQALRKLTGKDFGYDKAAWRSWLELQRKDSGAAKPPVDWGNSKNETIPAKVTR